MIDLIPVAYELAIGCFVGFTIGLTGVGGGVLIIPALTVLLGMPATTAVGTASAYAFLTKIFAGFEHWRLKTIDFAVAHLFLIGAIPGNIITCLVIGHLKSQATDPAALASMQEDLKSFIAGIMTFSVILMLANLMRDWWKDHKQTSTSTRTVTPLPDGMPWSRRIMGIGLGAMVGAILGATSVGGGVVIVPLLIICFGLTTRSTVGTSIYIALLLTLSTAALSAGRGDVDWQVAVVMSIGSLGGVTLGSRLANRLSEVWLQSAVIVLLVIAIIAMMLK